jgi:tetratricopeptide (TPR) repeat protein
VIAFAGKWTENRERAIAAYEAALEVYTREAFPEKWAMTQNNLGGAYQTRIRGERAENLERAIAAYEAALAVITREAFPADWAMTQGNLVSALVEQFKLTGEAEDLDAAITGLEEASQVAIPGTDAYASIHHTLGTALEYRHSLHSAVADLAQATAAYRRAAAATPWPDRQRRYITKAADSEYALGVALSQQGQWYESLEHLDTSLGLYREVGSRLGRADALQQVGRTHYLMGNFDKARIHLRDALRLYQAEGNLPGEAACHAGLGRLLLRLNFIDDAIAELDRACTQYRSLGDHTHLEELQAVYTLAQKVKEKQPL